MSEFVNHIKCYLLLLSLCFLAGSLKAQQEEIKWLTIEEAELLNKEKPRALLIDFYTDWCGWCKQMDKTTYADPVVISFVNKHFYPVKMNAESSDTIRFRNKVYAPVKNGSRWLNTLAYEMLKGQLSYPTTVFLYEKENINLVVPGYIDIPKMQAFMIFFAENAYLSTNVNDFIADFETVFKPEEGEVKKEEPAPYWTDFSELEEKRKTESKKLLIYLSASWNNSSKMMEKVVFPDSLFADLATKYFYCMHLDVQSQDSLTFMTHQFANAGSANNNLHQLAIALSDQILRVPSIYIFDEEGKMMERLYFYLDRERGKMVLDFLGTDTYKNMSWGDFMKIKAKEGL